MVGKQKNAKALIVAITKNEGPYIREWVSHYLSIGADHIAIYDNGSSDNSLEELRKFINHGYVTLLSFPKPNGQVEAYNHAISLFAPHFEWIGFFDADEFLVLKSHESLGTYLDAVPQDFDQIKIPWRVYGFSGHARKPAGLVTDNYVMAAPTGSAPVNCKSFVRSDAVRKFYCHIGEVAAGRTCDNNFAGTDQLGTIVHPDFTSAQVNHYYTKSEEEFLARVARGTADGTVKRGFGLERDGVYSIEDRSYFDHCSDKLKSFMQMMDNMPVNPMVFGESFALPYINHDGTIWDIGRVLSNYASKIPEPRNTFTDLKKNMWRMGGVMKWPNAEKFDLTDFIRSIHFRDFETKKQAFLHGLGDAAGADECKTSLNMRTAYRSFIFGELELPETKDLVFSVDIDDAVHKVSLQGIEAGIYIFALQSKDGYSSGYDLPLSVNCQGARFHRFATLLQP